MGNCFGRYKRKPLQIIQIDPAKAKAIAGQAQPRKRTLSEVIESQYPGMLAQQQQKVAVMSAQDRRIMNMYYGVRR